MLKKVLFIALALILFIGTALAQGTNLSIQIGFHQPEGETILNTDVVIQDNGYLMSSCLFPSYSLFVPADPALAASGKFQESCLFASVFQLSNESALNRLFSDLPDETRKGIFTGDLFNEARTEQSKTYPLADLFSVLSGDSEPNSLIQSVFSSGVIDYLSLLRFSEVNVHVRVFDAGKYAVLTGAEGSRTVFTLSSDFSVPGSWKNVFGYADNGRNYYWMFEEYPVTADEKKLHIALISDPDKKGYRFVYNNTPILEGDFVLTTIQDTGAVSFSGSIVPANGLTPMALEGLCTEKNNPFLTANIHFNGDDKNSCSLLISMNDDVSAVSQMKQISVEDLQNKTICDEILHEIRTQIAFCQEIIYQMLPADYIERLSVIR